MLNNFSTTVATPRKCPGLAFPHRTSSRLPTARCLLIACLGPPREAPGKNVAPTWSTPAPSPPPARHGGRRRVALGARGSRSRRSAPGLALHPTRPPAKMYLFLDDK